MKINYGMLAATLGALGFALSLAPSGAAQCLGGSQPRLTHSNWRSQLGQVQLLPAAFVPKDDGDDRDDHDASIVGFWHQQLVSKGTAGVKDGTVLDDGLAQWHSGTEILKLDSPNHFGQLLHGSMGKGEPAHLQTEPLSPNLGLHRNRVSWSVQSQSRSDRECRWQAIQGHFHPRLLRPQRQDRGRQRSGRNQGNPNHSGQYTAKHFLRRETLP